MNKKTTKAIIISLLIVLVFLGVYFFKDKLPFAITSEISSLNLVNNSGFEASSTGLIPNNWVYAGTDSNHQVIYDNSISHSGAKSIHLTVNNSSKSWFYVASDKIPTISGKKYYVEIWVKTSNLPVGCYPDSTTCQYADRFMLEMSNFNSTNNRISASFVVGGIGSTFINQDWIKLIGIYSVPSGVVSFQPRLFLYTTKGDVWYDDIRISEIGQDVNLTFPNGDAELWAETSKTSSATSIGVNNVPVGWVGNGYLVPTTYMRSTDSQKGLYSLRIDIPATAVGTTGTVSWAGADSIQLTQGTTYEFSGYVKTTGRIRIYVARRDSQALVKDKVITGTGNWEKISIKFVAPATISQGYKIAFESNVSYNVDNVKVENLGLATSCSQLSQCSSDEECSGGYCQKLNCIQGYHAEDHICVLGQAEINFEAIALLVVACIGIGIVIYLVMRK